MNIKKLESDIAKLRISWQRFDDFVFIKESTGDKLLSILDEYIEEYQRVKGSLGFFDPEGDQAAIRTYVRADGVVDFLEQFRKNICNSMNERLSVEKELEFLLNKKQKETGELKEDGDYSRLNPKFSPTENKEK